MPRLSLISFTAQQSDSAFLLCLKFSQFSLEHFKISSSGLLLTVSALYLYFMTFSWSNSLLLGIQCCALQRAHVGFFPACSKLKLLLSPPELALPATITSLQQFAHWKTLWCILTCVYSPVCFRQWDAFSSKLLTMTRSTVTSLHLRTAPSSTGSLMNTIPMMKHHRNRQSAQIGKALNIFQKRFYFSQNHWTAPKGAESKLISDYSALFLLNSQSAKVSQRNTARSF